jgi:hypothetical protein
MRVKRMQMKMMLMVEVTGLKDQQVMKFDQNGASNHFIVL